MTLTGALVGSVVRGALTAYYDVQAQRGATGAGGGGGGGEGSGGGGNAAVDAPLPAAARQLVELLVSDPARRLLREVTAAGVATAVRLCPKRSFSSARVRRGPPMQPVKSSIRGSNAVSKTVKCAPLRPCFHQHRNSINMKHSSHAYSRIPNSQTNRALSSMRFGVSLAPPHR